MNSFKSITSSIYLIWAIIRNQRRKELKNLRKIREELTIRITKMVDDYATPDQKVLPPSNSYSMGKLDQNFKKLTNN